MQTHSHGNLRGLDASRSPNFEGRFGRMFRNLAPADFKLRDLVKLSKAMIRDPDPDEKDDPAESSMPAGYTYFAQFVDHDITFDPASSLERDNDPDALVDYRTPRFDLDSIYGRGPADQPYLYRDDFELVLGNRVRDHQVWDLPRVESTGRAIIGDPRNDENMILGQLHTIFLQLHNRVAEGMRKEGRDFAAVQQLVRWCYQWAILYDFLPRIIDKKTYDEVLPDFNPGCNIQEHPPELRFYKPRQSPFLPVEFSAAAYRFGHSTIRDKYKVHRRGESAGPFPIFDEKTKTDLRGFQPLTTAWFINWSLFFEGVSSEVPVQRAHRIRTSLAQPLANLPREVAPHMASLAKRNLIRGWRLGLPSGQAVACAMGIKPIDDQELTVGTPGTDNRVTYLKDVSKQFYRNAPLWYYILREAEKEHQGEKLGPVGGRIVMETFVGLLMADSHSYLRQCPSWTPYPLDQNPEKFGVADLIRIAIGQQPPPKG